MQQFNDRYWVSPGIHTGPLQSTSLEVCLLSLVLEAGIRNGIAGVRIVIIYPLLGRPWWDNHTVVIDESPNGRTFFRDEGNTARDSQPQHAYDQASTPGPHRLAKERMVAKLLHKPRGAPEGSTNVLPTLQVVLRLSPVDQEAERLANGFSEDYPPQRILKIHDVRIGPGEPNHPIIFDKVYRVDPDHAAISLTLESDVPFVMPDWQSDRDVEPIDVMTFSFHILDASTQVNPTLHQSKIHDLPPEILLEIVGATVPPLSSLGSNSNHWQETILSCALVCRYWSFLVRVYFEKVGKGYPVGDFFGLVNSLIDQPHLRPLIRTFSEDHLLGAIKERYVIPNDKEMDPDLVEWCQILLGMTTSLSKVVIDQRLLASLLPHLGQRSSVDTFDLIDSSWDRDPTVPNITFDGLHALLRKWKQLKTLSIHALLKRPDVVAVESQLPPLPFSLTSLSLGRGTYRAGQLFPLFSSSRTSLKHLTLAIEGLTNDDLLQLLSLVAPNLVTLSLFRGKFPAAHDMETRALDAILPQAPNLVEVTVGDDNATPSCLLRKEPCFSHRAYNTAEEPCCSIFIRPTERGVQWHPQVLRHVLTNTGWVRIVLGIHDDDNHWYTAEEIEGLEKVAKENGINLRIMMYARRV